MPQDSANPPTTASATAHAPTAPNAGPFFFLRNATYPDHYVWYIFASSLDVMLTYVIVGRLQGAEVNALANHLLQRFGHWGLILLKFSSIILVIAICEWVARLNVRKGRTLATLAVVISAFPVGAGLLQIAAWLGLGE